ncbi:MAG: glutamate-5-semialdehyde dehydrogenase [Lachnospiraceae bacterium]|nr:glutamate-5-semialdehyde dehydrogenase [Lachnospiraceae bacterium]
MNLQEIGRHAQNAKHEAGKLSSGVKDAALRKIADALEEHSAEILTANGKDLKAAREPRMPSAMLDLLVVSEDPIHQMALGLRQVADLEDPIGEVISMKQRPNGLMIGQKRVPLGVVGIIYESRPNVTADAFALCFKTSNVVILKGGSDAIHSNVAIVACIRETLEEQGITPDMIQIIEDTDRQITVEFMRMNQYVDVLIPRGGAGLIRSVVENATIPVIETGTGNCLIYVEEGADLDMAAAIIQNAKTQRVGVCNACESLLVHESVVEELIPRVARNLEEAGVEIFADETIRSVAPETSQATEEDWGREYQDYKLSRNTVPNIDDAIAHINRYNTGHSEAIITNNYSHAQQFLNEVDAAAVYVNASTRFTDGFEFGFGAEIGISTQKLHARGPMGLLALTTTKYIIYGNGQVRG